VTLCHELARQALEPLAECAYAEGMLVQGRWWWVACALGVNACGTNSAPAGSETSAGGSGGTRGAGGAPPLMLAGSAGQPAIGLGGSGAAGGVSGGGLPPKSTATNRST
jgi:hypothetical protein